jgi:NAD(P)-dependent dehydrogenase (short-subunit alcohol dehydrogenase family)
MPPDVLREQAGTILLIGASRGLGHAIAAEFLTRGWKLVGTVRPRETRTKLHDLADEFQGRVEIEVLDICAPDQIAALRQRLSSRVFDMLFVNTGVTNKETETIADVATEEFFPVIATNALSPMRVIESMTDLVAATGLLAVMSSGQGSVINNETGMRETRCGGGLRWMRSLMSRCPRTNRLVGSPLEATAGYACVDLVAGGRCGAECYGAGGHWRYRQPEL